FRVHVRWDGEGLLCAAGPGILGRGEDLGPAAVQGHRRRPEGAADLARDGRAGDAVVAVLVVGGDLAELVPGQLGGAGVVRRGLFWGGVAGKRPDFRQGPGGREGVGATGA